MSLHRRTDCVMCAQSCIRLSALPDVSSAALCSRCALMVQAWRQPRCERESFLGDRGHAVVGVDEVGRGALAGPVVAAAVSLDGIKLQALCPRDRDLIRDSKTLSALQRLRARDCVQRVAREYAVASVGPQWVDQWGIAMASRRAMEKALAKLHGPYQVIWVDGRDRLDVSMHQYAIVRGDQECLCVGAASLLAKTYRDSVMKRLPSLFPRYQNYGFERHVGYGTKDHRQALQLLGGSAMHRRSFAPLKDL